MKRKTLNLLLGAVALALVSVSVFQERRDEAKLAEPPKKGEPLSAIAPASVDHVVLHHAEAPDIVLERKAGRWNLGAPVQAPADAVEVGKLLAIASAETVSRLDAATVKRADFGLEPPQFTLSLGDTVFAFGEIERLRYLRYVEVDSGKPGDRLALIADPDHGAFDSDYTDLLSKALLPPEAEIVRIELPGLKVERGKDAQWRAQPAAAEATQEDFNAFVEAWKQAISVRNETPPPGESKQLVATLSFADGSTRAFRIVSREPQLILDDASLKVRYRFAADVSRQLLVLPKPKAAAKADAAAEGPAAAEAGAAK
ncbi:MAG: hypothetical protein NVS9B10_20370 [Nevskia sp.]